jgi:hypothetical protein
METINQIRSKLFARENNYISDNQFSQQYLGRCRSYISVVKHSKGRISDSALLALYVNLSKMSQSWQEIAETSPQDTESRAHQNQHFFRELSGLVWAELEKRVSS